LAGATAQNAVGHESCRGAGELAIARRYCSASSTVNPSGTLNRASDCGPTLTSSASMRSRSVPPCARPAARCPGRRRTSPDGPRPAASAARCSRVRPPCRGPADGRSRQLNNRRSRRPSAAARRPSARALPCGPDRRDRIRSPARWLVANIDFAVAAAGAQQFVAHHGAADGDAARPPSLCPASARENSNTMA